MSAECGSVESDRIRCASTLVEPTSPTLGPSSARFCPNRANVGAIPSNFGASSTMSGRYRQIWGGGTMSFADDLLAEPGECLSVTCWRPSWSLDPPARHKARLGVQHTITSICDGPPTCTLGQRLNGGKSGLKQRLGRQQPRHGDSSIVSVYGGSQQPRIDG